MELRQTLALPREELSIPLTRRILAHALQALGCGPDCAHDILVALTEACTNVLAHSEEGTAYDVVASIREDECTIDIVDTGAGFDVGAVGLPALAAEHGRGIALMRALTDQIAFESRPHDGTVVRLVKRMQWLPDAPLRRLSHPDTAVR